MTVNIVKVVPATDTLSSYAYAFSCINHFMRYLSTLQAKDEVGSKCSRVRASQIKHLDRRGLRTNF